MTKTSIDPEKWGQPVKCTSCSWTASEDETSILLRAFFPHRGCPRCRSPLTGIVKHFPCCEKPVPRVRLPQSWRMFWWGGHFCHDCFIEYDKWGERIPEGNS